LALDADLRRPEFESLTCDVGPLITEIREARANLQHWMEPQNVATDLLNQPASSKLHRVPKGLIFIIGPWNFPLLLVFQPLVGAIAAGNCALLKPSEVAKASEALIAELCAKYLDQSAIRCLTGAVPETTELLSMHWDHIFYTGNGAVAKIVMTAAAQHLTPVTLELGGKCPVIVDKGLTPAKMRVACRRILHFGLYVNAGQICMSPDYVLVHKDAEQALTKTMAEVVKEFAPRKGKDKTETLGKIVAERHFDRISSLVDNSGGTVVCGGIGEADRSQLYMPPTIISRPSLDSQIMREEIFGPVMLIVPVDSIDTAIEHINRLDAPLVLYMVTEDAAMVDKVVSNTTSGSVLINDAVTHVGNLNLPFGGVGPSGMGAYHGKYSFDEFTHLRPVMFKGLSLDADRYPPYTPAKVKLIQKLQGLGDEPLIPKWLPKAGMAIAAIAGGLAMKSRL